MAESDAFDDVVLGDPPTLPEDVWLRVIAAALDPDTARVPDELLPDSGELEVDHGFELFPPTAHDATVGHPDGDDSSSHDIAGHDLAGHDLAGHDLAGHDPDAGGELHGDHWGQHDE